MNTLPDPTPILDYIEAFRRSKVMFTALKLGVFDQLAIEPQTAERLAETLRLNPGALARLLDACVALQLLMRKGSAYCNTATAKHYLVTASPRSFAGYIAYSEQSLYPLWSHLDDAVREGTNRWAQTFGSKDTIFDYFYRDPAATANFVRAMNGFGQLCSPLVVKAFDLSRFTHLVDLGGATGHLAVAACEVYPALRATILDLSRVETFAREYIANSSAASRISFVVADFFSDPLPTADLYSLGRILHDWDDNKIHLLLRKIYDALPAGGGVVIVEALLNDDRSGPLYAFMQDINMLICTDGRERTAGEYGALLGDAGFIQVQSHRTGSPVDAVLAIKE